ncbi:MAG: Cys-tRNA(Pro) deacylase [Oscillospiraceae bacterium]|nr:Cys-tRNA(Pro) deacylase [Oscillospiraceae bacterium]
MEEKTNVMRILDRMKIPYKSYSFPPELAVNAVAVAGIIGKPPESVFKTLVTEGKSKPQRYFVFMIPSGAELDLKKAAASVGEKSVEMIKMKDLLPVTGYIHGGCSPIGMKKEFVTVIDSSVSGFETIAFSAGKVGYQVEMTPENLFRAVRLASADITANIG